MPKNTPVTHYSAILQVFSSNSDTFFSVSELAEMVRLQFPLLPCRETILSVIHQLEKANILESEIHRKYAQKIPVTVYKYKFN